MRNTEDGKGGRGRPGERLIIIPSRDDEDLVHESCREGNFTSIQEAFKENQWKQTSNRCQETRYLKKNLKQPL